MGGILEFQKNVILKLVIPKEIKSWYSELMGI